MAGTRIQYSSVDDYVVVGLRTIRPTFVRAVLASPALALATLFALVAAHMKSGAGDVVWLCVMSGLCLFAFAQFVNTPKPLVGPASSEFTTMPVSTLFEI